MPGKQFTTEVGGKTLTIETGKLAQQASASCTARLGDTVVLAAATMSKDLRDGIDYFPLTVDYEERLYAAGKIKGSRFIKREGRPTDDAILTARIVDRSIRPLFQQDMRNDVQVVLTVLSVDQENDPDMVALWAASCALAMSPIPWKGPITGARVGRVDGAFVINPTTEQREKSEFDLVVVGHDDRTLMIELEGHEIPENVVTDAIAFAQQHWNKPLDLIKDVVKAVGKEKVVPGATEATAEEQLALTHLESVVKAFGEAKMTGIFEATDKASRKAALDALKDELEAQLKADNKVSKENREKGMELFELEHDRAARKLMLEKKKRVDGRALDEIRDLSSEVGLLPRTHGSALFQRGETQVLSIVTLGSPGDEQTLDTMGESGKKRYMHHYNFPGYSTGEVKRIGSTGRREIGHGALAEKALEPMLPSKEDFPYTIRVVSEVLSSNGSSSQASICGSTLSLMDAGVPIKAPVAGISIGLVTADDGSSFELLTDIQGIEDHAGDMDFKVAGTKDGITAIQLDVKDVTLSNEVIQAAFERAKAARMKILEVMTAAIAAPRPELSPYAPRIVSIRIDPEKIRDVIGKGGETINGMIEEFGGPDVTKIDIEQDGLVVITSTNAEFGKQAKERIEQMTREVQIGEIYEGTVMKIVTDMRGNEIGAIVEFLPGHDGMVHVSELSVNHVERVTDMLQVGDKAKVIVKDVDKERGRTSLSIKRLSGDFKESDDQGDDRSRFRGGRPGGFGGRGGGHGGGRGTPRYGGRF